MSYLGDFLLAIKSGHIQEVFTSGIECSALDCSTCPFRDGCDSMDSESIEWKQFLHNMQTLHPELYI